MGGNKVKGQKESGGVEGNGGVGRGVKGEWKGWK